MRSAAIRFLSLRQVRSVETITGRLGYAAAARSGAINGVLLGLLFSAIFVLGTPNAAIQLFAGVMLVGIAIGMLLSILTYALLRRRRDYTSVTQVLGDRYEVTVLPRSIHPDHLQQPLGRRIAPHARTFGQLVQHRQRRRARAAQGHRRGPLQEDH